MYYAKSNITFPVVQKGDDISHDSVTCTLCPAAPGSGNNTMRRFRLNTQFSEKHPGLVLNAGFEPVKAKPINSFFPPQAPAPASDNAPRSRSPDQGDADRNVRPRLDSPAHQPPPPPMDVSCLISKFESLGKKVDNLNTSVNNLRAPATAAQIATQLHALQKEDARKAAADAEKKKVEQSIRAATVEEIATKYDFIIECRHNGAFLVCKCCQSHSTRGTPGGTAGPPGEINTTNVRLYDVKRRVLSHMGTKTHLEALPRYKKHQNRTSLLEAYGYRISRTAYNTILEGRSYESFERDLLLQSLNGVDLGNFNHSNDFCRTFLSHLHTELKTLVVAGINDPQDVLGGRKPPFALNADKATMLHRTGHIVGLLIIDEGAIKAVLISDDVVPAKESDGENLAKAIIAALEPFLSGDHKAAQISLHRLRFRRTVLRLECARSDLRRAQGEEGVGLLPVGRCTQAGAYYW